MGVSCRRGVTNLNVLKKLSSDRRSEQHKRIFDQETTWWMSTICTFQSYWHTAASFVARWVDLCCPHQRWSSSGEWWLQDWERWHRWPMGCRPPGMDCWVASAASSVCDPLLQMTAAGVTRQASAVSCLGQNTTALQNSAVLCNEAMYKMKIRMHEEEWPINLPRIYESDLRKHASVKLLREKGIKCGKLFRNGHTLSCCLSHEIAIREIVQGYYCFFLGKRQFVLKHDTIQLTNVSHGCKEHDRDSRSSA